MDDGFSVSTPELAECARINFQNVVKMVPQLRAHPIFIMAMDQLSAVAARLNDEPSPTPATER